MTSPKPLSTKHGWSARRAIIFKDRSWHYECLDELKARQRLDRSSLGLIPVADVEKVTLKPRPPESEEKHRERAAEMQQTDLFRGRQPELEWFPSRVHVSWRCRSPSCGGHGAQVFDWGLGELGRREGEAAMLSKMQSIADPRVHDLRFFMGNIKSYPRSFVIVGVWYPKLKHMQQTELMLAP